MKSGIKIAVLVSLFATLLLATVGCKKKDSNPKTPTPTPNVPTPVVIDINHDAVAQYSVEGAGFSYPSNGIEGGMTSSASLASSMTGTSYASYGSFFSDDAATYFGVEKGTIYTPGIGRPSEEAFRAFFAVGNVNYSPNNLDGIMIEHRAADGTMWTTDKGTADQTGSLFKIEAVKETNDSYQNIKVYATFNCKLYDDNGNSKTLTNGKFVGYFENN